MANDGTISGRRVRLTVPYNFRDLRPLPEGSLGTVVEATDGRGGTLVPAANCVHVRMDLFPDILFQLPIDRLFVLSLLDALAEVSNGP